jgi:hypothetical protein
MNTKELDEELDYFRERITHLANGGMHSEQSKNSLLGVANKLEAAKDDRVPYDVKATVLSIGKLVLRAARLPPGTSFAGIRCSS